MFDLGDIGDFIYGTGGAAQSAHDQYKKGIDNLQAADVESGPSAFNSADPATRAAQLEGLATLRQKYQAGGLDAIDRGRLGDINDQQNTAAATQRAAVAQGAARRGLWNSGNQLVAAQLGGQQAVTQGSVQARNAASLAEQARMGALAGASGLAGDIRGQDYQKAGALDAISRFNAAQRLHKAQGVSDIYGQDAGQYNADANRRKGEVGGIYAGVGQMTGVGQASKLASGGGGGSAADGGSSTGLSGAGASGMSPEELAAMGIV